MPWSHPPHTKIQELNSNFDTITYFYIYKHLHKKKKAKQFILSKDKSKSQDSQHKSNYERERERELKYLDVAWGQGWCHRDTLKAEVLISRSRFCCCRSFNLQSRPSQSPILPSQSCSGCSVLLLLPCWVFFFFLVENCCLAESLLLLRSDSSDDVRFLLG